MSQSDKNSHDELPKTSLFTAKLDLSVDTPRSGGHDVPFPTIPNNEIDRCIGKGGFGAVFRAVRRSDVKAFAIKILHVAGGVGNDMRQRFLREATILCQLEHPRIVSFRELGISGSDRFLVMDYVENTSWKELSQRLSLPKKIEIATGVPSGLAEWIHCGLQTDPAKRFQTTQQMRDMLKAIPRD